MLIFTPEYLAKLNAQYQGGIFVKTVEMVEDPTGPVIKYFVDHCEPIVFNGHTYEPLHMVWDNMRTSSGMTLEAATITVSNLAGKVGKYLKEIDVTDNEVILRLLHLDLLAQTTGHWQRKGFILAVSANSTTATFTVGRRLGRSVMPRKVFLVSEFPGLTNEKVRIFS